MKTIVLLLFAAVSWSQTLTTVTGTFHCSDGVTLFSGQVQISNPPFTTYDGYPIQPTPVKLVTVTAGTFSISLNPTDSGIPAIGYQLLFTAAATGLCVPPPPRTWWVPISSSPVQESIALLQPPTGRFMSTVDISSAGQVHGLNGQPVSAASTQVNGQTCALGGSCTVPAGSSVSATFTAGASITKGTLVSLSAANTVKSGLPIATGPLTPVGTYALTTNQYNSAALGSSFVVVYNDTGNSGKLTAIVGTQTGSPVATVSFGSSVLLPSSNSAGSTSAILTTQNVAALSSSAFVVTYRDSTDSSHLYSAVGAVSGNAITFGTAVLVASLLGTGSTSISCITQDLDSTHFVVGFVDTTNANVYTAAAASVSGTTITFGTQVAPTVSVETGFGQYPLVVLSPTSFVIFTGSTSGFYAVAGAVSSGTAITFGSNVELGTGVANTSPAEFALGTSGSFGVAFIDTTTTPSKYVSLICSTSSTTITKGTEVQVPSFSSNVIQSASTILAQDLDSAHFALMYTDTTNGSKQTSAAASVSGTAITFGAATLVSSGSVGTSFSLIRLDSTHLIAFFLDTLSGATWQTSVGLITGTSVSWSSKVGVDFPILTTSAIFFLPALNSTQALVTDASFNFGVVTYQGQWAPVGIAESSVSSAASVSVLLSGDGSGLFSGLTAGALYYAQGDGTIGTAITTSPVGVALNATDILIQPFLSAR